VPHPGLGLTTGPLSQQLKTLGPELSAIFAVEWLAPELLPLKRLSNTKAPLG
jgi:hypothetical protein